jgi:acyl-CoA dehydrogenase
MNFEFSADQKLLGDQARKFLADNCASTEVRKILEGSDAYHYDLWHGIAELGWLGTAIPEAYGGLGAGYLELCVLAEELGRALAPVPFSSSIYLAAEALLLAGTEDQKQRWLPRLASGEAIGTFAIAESSGGASLKSVHASVSDGRLTGLKLPVPDGDSADLAVVAALPGDKQSAALYLVGLDAPGVSRSPIDAIDPTRSQAQVVFDGTPVEPLGDETAGESFVSQLYDRAAILFAFEQLGGAQRVLEMGRDYALERYAFGRPIGAFQAIKHTLADMYVSEELARSNCYYGAWALSTPT